LRCDPGNWYVPWHGKSYNLNMNGDKPSVYVETSIVSYLAARPSRNALRKQQWQVYGEDTQAWFDALLRSQARRVNA
jgi:hypothetical protein